MDSQRKSLVRASGSIKSVGVKSEAQTIQNIHLGEEVEITDTHNNTLNIAKVISVQRSEGWSTLQLEMIV